MLERRQLVTCLGIREWTIWKEMKWKINPGNVKQVLKVKETKIKRDQAQFLSQEEPQKLS